MNAPAKLGFGGMPPTVLIKPTNPEREKYRRMWDRPEYRRVAPGEIAATAFLTQARLRHDVEVLDFGCGTGRGAMMIAALGGAKVKMLDFADNCLDPEVRQALETQNGRLTFAVCDLTRPIPHKAAYGYCTDVMEHIPPEDVLKVLRNILLAAEHVFFQIACVPDELGALIGEPLHLTVQPPAWWIQQLTGLGAVVHWTASDEQTVMVYCSAWGEAKEIISMGKVNVGETVADAHVRQNVLDGWAHAQPHDKQDREVVLLAGGPSLNDHVREVFEMRAAGAALVTVNGAYEWALDHGLVPSLQIMLDAREFNSRFVRRAHSTCKYMMASQCHPGTLAGLPRDRTWLWHSGVSETNEALIREKTGHFFPIPGGSTVVLRAIPLLRMLGFAKVHIFGFDSCVLPEAHHAYAQAENDGEITVPVTCGGKVFDCTPWMMSQAAEFRDLVRFLGDEVELAVYGKGLIAHMIQYGAELAQKE
jgi:SAM-dependent methyltransferase